MSRSRMLSALLLYPVSRVYAFVMWVRNRMFDHGILKQEEFDVPVISVGNIAVGGTGKTPHVEYLANRLMETHHLAVLSRGYKRSTRGFVLASPQSRPEDIGDESYQIYRKFGPNVTVAVCANRREGIRRLLEIDPKIDMILLDDAFQHRYVKPSASIVLTEYSRPLYTDEILPYGRLREPKSSLNRADIVVVTKCISDMTPMQYRIFEENLRLFPFQKLYFSTYDYGQLVPVFPDAVENIPAIEDLAPDSKMLALSGVANPRPFVKHLRQRNRKVKVKLRRFADHHNFTARDMEHIEREFKGMPEGARIIITTEKDAMRLFNNPYFPHELKPHIFYLPIKVRFIDRGEPEFASVVEKTVREARLFK